MRLADFIRRDMEAILAEWEGFAAALLPAAAGLTSLALRDHATQILEAMAIDLGTTQTRDEQAEKGKGRAPKAASAQQTAAQTHAILRARGGFDIKQLVAEYRALRASVLRLWMDTSPLDDAGVEDMIRFNEAIDQAVAESVDYFSAQVERARNLLLGMLGHDMRSPLSTIVTTAAYLSAFSGRSWTLSSIRAGHKDRTELGGQINTCLAARVHRSARRWGSRQRGRPNCWREATCLEACASTPLSIGCGEPGGRYGRARHLRSWDPGRTNATCPLGTGW